MDTSEPRDVKVQIHLAGGQRHDLVLASNALLLRDLFTALSTKAQSPTGHQPMIFQVPLKAGHAALSFSSEQLVSIVTEPPVLIDSTHAAIALGSAPVIPATYTQFDDFLTPDEQRQLLAYALEREPDFEPGTAFTDDSDYRKSQVLGGMDDTPWAALFRSRLKVYVAHFLQRLGQPIVPVEKIEVQLTASNDGEYYKRHTDTGHESTAAREVSFVYYFYAAPKKFSGGELRLYDSPVANPGHALVESFREIEPRNNSIVFFFSRSPHEILPVRCPSRAFADSRFTMNGWFNRKQDGSAANAVR